MWQTSHEGYFVKQVGISLVGITCIHLFFGECDRQFLPQALLVGESPMLMVYPLGRSKTRWIDRTRAHFGCLKRITPCMSHLQHVDFGFTVQQASGVLAGRYEAQPRVKSANIALSERPFRIFLQYFPRCRSRTEINMSHDVRMRVCHTGARARMRACTKTGVALIFMCGERRACYHVFSFPGSKVRWTGLRSYV